MGNLNRITFYLELGILIALKVSSHFATTIPDFHIFINWLCSSNVETLAQENRFFRPYVFIEVATLGAFASDCHEVIV